MSVKQVFDFGKTHKSRAEFCSKTNDVMAEKKQIK